MRRFVLLTAGLLALSTALPGLAEDSPKPAASDDPATRLVRAALEAELDGRNVERQQQLRKAIATAPDDAAARAQLGQVRVAGQWLPVAKAQARAKADPRLAKYQELRASTPLAATPQAELARWCRRNVLADQERVHWNAVLWLDASERDLAEAVKRLALQRFRGQWLTRDDVVAWKHQVQRAQKATDRWRPRATAWRRDYLKGTPDERAAVLANLAKFDDWDALAVLEAELSQKSEPLGLELVRVLGTSRQPNAVASLVRHAVLAPHEKVRGAAIAELKKRPRHDYVPWLLDALAAPIESSYAIVTHADGTVDYSHTLYRSGPFADAVWQSMQSFVVAPPSRTTINSTGGPSITVYEGPTPAEQAGDLAAARATFATQLARTKGEIERINSRIDELNGRLIAVLRAATGESLSDNPQQWWKWWLDYTDRYQPTDRPLFEQVTYANWYSPPRGGGGGHGGGSCFARGTPVWTESGIRPIESLLVGDRVLAQDPETGDLTFKPVIGTTIRPTQSLVRITCGSSDVLHATGGHPFWVAGKGWRMAKQLSPGDRLHTPSGSVEVTSVAAQSLDEDALNLIVADSHSYFVGERGLLVHDNTPQRPTAALLPGLVERPSP